jgi:hypothetical protein
LNALGALSPILSLTQTLQGALNCCAAIVRHGVSLGERRQEARNNMDASRQHA